MGRTAILLQRQLKAAQRRFRELLMIGHALLSTEHPVLVHLVPMRRCNLSCAYCNEYDRVSNPVSLPLMRQRVDRLASLGASIITMSGGEPLLHPELESIVSQVREQGMIAGVITNGYLLSRERIERLNRVGLDHLQISIDNVRPDAVSKKSLQLLDNKLQWLAELADFHVNINSVVGSGVNHPEDAATIARRAAELGFSSTVGVIHDRRGQLRALAPAEARAYREALAAGKRSYAHFTSFQDSIVQGGSHRWRCRAGSRYLYICEDGLVHYCSQQRGHPGIPLSQYTRADLRREFSTEKPCAPQCTVACVHRVSYLDAWRAPQRAAPPLCPPELVQIHGD
jgi:MoaA/NifB/PqqE/SkfB family radical SAM enzyme